MKNKQNASLAQALVAIKTASTMRLTALDRVNWLRLAGTGAHSIPTEIRSAISNIGSLWMADFQFSDWRSGVTSNHLSRARIFYRLLQSTELPEALHGSNRFVPLVYSAVRIAVCASLVDGHFCGLKLVDPEFGAVRDLNGDLAAAMESILNAEHSEIYNPIYSPLDVCFWR